jgi:DNA repair protein RadC
MNYNSLDKLSPAELVASVLGKKIVDDECHRIATIVTSEDWIDGEFLAEVAREQGPAAIGRIARINSAIELGRRTMTARAEREHRYISKPQDVVELMWPRMSGLETERFYCLCLNTKNMLKRVVEVSTGSINASIVHPRDLF